MVDRELDTDLEQPNETSALSLLLELGKKKGYITLDDIITISPDAEQDVNRLEEIFTSMLNAGIEYIEDESMEEPGDEELDQVNPVKESRKTAEEGILAGIDSEDTIGLYLKEVGTVPLLTAEEEVNLSQRIERGRLAREELARGNVNVHRRKELQIMIQDGWYAREHLITANSRLVISVAKRYMGRGVPFLDLIQEGNIGLIRAAKKFDYRRGHKFSTYATWWIRQAVSRAIADQGRTIRVPVHMGDQINKLLRLQHQLTQSLEREPTIDELAASLGVPPSKIENMLRVAMRPLSLETPTDDEEDSVLGDFIQDDEIPAPDDSATFNLLKEHLEVVLDGLPAREVRILQLRYGLLDGQTYTLEQVGRKMGVTRERVRQIEAQALSRLRHPSVRRKLQEYLS